MYDAHYNINLAAEFYALSVLHRLGADATLTLGNKKSADIAVVKGAGNTVTVDVKGLAGTTSWPVDNVKGVKNGHFLVFCATVEKSISLTFCQKFGLFRLPPWSRSFTFYPRGGALSHRSKLRREAKEFKDAWGLLT
jgi:hypothetical protein